MRVEVSVGALCSHMHTGCTEVSTVCIIHCSNLVLLLAIAVQYTVRQIISQIPTDILF